MKDEIIDKLKEQYQDIRSSIVGLDESTKNDRKLQSIIDDLYYYSTRINKTIEAFEAWRDLK